MKWTLIHIFLICVCPGTRYFPINCYRIVMIKYFFLYVIVFTYRLFRHRSFEAQGFDQTDGRKFLSIHVLLGTSDNCWQMIKCVLSVTWV